MEYSKTIPTVNQNCNALHFLFLATGLSHLTNLIADFIVNGLVVRRPKSGFQTLFDEF